MLYETAGPGTLLDYRNKTDASQDINYASLTAPGVVRCEVRVDDDLIDVVYAGAGASHSWWAGAQGKLLPASGLLPGQHLQIIVDGPAALRIEWF